MIGGCLATLRAIGCHTVANYAHASCTLPLFLFFVYSCRFTSVIFLDSRGNCEENGGGEGRGQRRRNFKRGGGGETVLARRTLSGGWVRVWVLVCSMRMQGGAIGGFRLKNDRIDRLFWDEIALSDRNLSMIKRHAKNSNFLLCPHQRNCFMRGGGLRGEFGFA